jgi:hypothetical protein
MRRTFIMIALSGLFGCYLKTPTHDGELDGGSEQSDASSQDAEVEIDADADNMEDADARAATCACSAPTRICLPETLRCVECQRDSDCGNGAHCLTASGQCVECLDASHCANRATASVCEPTLHRCSPCRTDADCSNVDGLRVCNAGSCVQCAGERRSACGEDKPACNAQLTCAVCTADADCQRFGKVCDEASARCVACTLDSEKAQCGTKSCDPMTKQCTQTERASVALCNRCVADSECMADQRCIDLSFAGSPRGGYCMQRISACAPPFQAPPLNRVSRSGAALDDYCGIVEQRTSCEAILALQATQSCSEASQCNAPGAFCASLNGGIAKTCTYACETNFECPDTIPCRGTGTDKYCGR